MLVKDNQPTLHQEIRQAFVIPKGFPPPYRVRLAQEARQTATTTEKSHGRVETRTLTSTTVGIDTCDWPGVKQMLRLERTTTSKSQTKTTVSYAVTSASREQANAPQLLKWWRGRWEIESTYWVRDQVFGEDHHRSRTGSAPFALSQIRNAAINFCRTLKLGNIQAALREHALKLDVLLIRLRIVK